MSLDKPTIEEKRQVARPHEYDGSLTAIWELLRALDMKVELHLQEEAEIRPKLLELIDILIASKGLLKFLKWISATAAALLAIHTFFGKYFVWKG
jgi:hypothetical protein